MTDTCPVCGTPVRISGGMTKHYVPDTTVSDIRALERFAERNAHDFWLGVMVKTEIHRLRDEAREGDAHD